VGTLSGRRKARLVLAMLVWQRPNLLLLDEPTNHLDLATREALSMALNEFEGTVMLVSHDRALREVCDEFWLVADGGSSPSTATWTTTSAGCWNAAAGPGPPAATPAPAPRPLLRRRRAPRLSAPRPPPAMAGRTARPRPRPAPSWPT
jgi:ATP-binding cassette subfamily F protein 3